MANEKRSMAPAGIACCVCGKQPPGPEITQLCVSMKDSAGGRSSKVAYYCIGSGNAHRACHEVICKQYSMGPDHKRLPDVWYMDSLLVMDGVAEDAADSSQAVSTRDDEDTTPGQRQLPIELE